jgi:hypothetical protein
VLPWSRNHRSGLVLAAALLVAGLAGLAGVRSAGAQEQTTPTLNRAVLLSGPTPVKGIPVYPPNRIPSFEGVYALEVDQGADQETGRKETSGGSGLEEEAGQEAQAPRLTVLFSRQDLLVPRTWTARRCGIRQLYQVRDHETFALCYHSERGFYLFFLFPETEEPAYWCAFSEALIERFLFLLNFVKSDTAVPFPAILQLD